MLDKRSWSGTDYMMYKSLVQAGHEIIVIDPIEKSVPFKKITAFLDKVSLHVYGKKYNWSRNKFLAYILSKRIGRRIKSIDYDIVFAPAGSVELYYFDTSKPVIYLSDATFEQISKYYDQYKNFFDFSIKESCDFERVAIEKSKILIYPTKWVIDHVLKNYNVTENKVVYAHLGANIENYPVGNKIDVDARFSKKKILFLGRDWSRKGGEIVYATFLGLIEKGYDCELIVCGCIPPYNHEKMKVISLLDKNNEKDRVMFENMLYEACVLFVPTRAECYGIVYCEAAAYGLPVIATETGGVSSIVEDEKTGFLLQYNASIDEYVNKISLLFESKYSYVEMSNNARRRYKEVLNWTVWADKFTVAINNVLSDKVSAINPDWSRERSKCYWNPGVRLLSSIRDYQKYKNRKIYTFHKYISVLRHRFWSAVSGADIPLNCKIGGGLLLPHPNGVVIHPDVEIGVNCLIFQQVTLGKGKNGVPKVGGHVDIGAGAKVIGDITIGSHVVIGANSVVLKDVPDNKTVKGVPAS